MFAVTSSYISLSLVVLTRGIDLPSPPTLFASALFLLVITPSTSLSTFHRIFERFKAGLFGVMYILVNQELSPTAIGLMATVAFEAFQLMDYSFAVSMFRWNTQLATALSSAFSSVQLHFFYSNPSLYWGTIYAVICLVAVTVVHAAVIGQSFANGRLKFVWTFWIMRGMCR